MREIKFRYWCSQRKKMFIEPMDSYYTGDYFGDERFTPLQYAGFKDKNNQEIFEGDIVKLTEFVDIRGEKTETYICKVDYRGLGFNITNNVFSFKSWEQIEVIGNIFETPHLLETK